MPGALHHTFTGISAFRRDHVYVPAIADELADRGEDHALIFRWYGRQWAHRPLPFAVGSVCPAVDGAPIVLAMGVGGEVNVFTNPGAPGAATEQIDESEEGPSELVPLRSIRMIGSRVYAAGMARRVYRREVPGRWAAIDNGVYVPRGQRDRGVGFNAIDGVAEDAIFAVGYQGEIWRYDGANWQQIESPTNVALTTVRCLDRDRQFAAGLAGVLLRGANSNWEPIAQDVTDGDFWGMTVFQNQVYVAGYEGVFRIEGDGVVPIPLDLGPEFTTAYLDANDGVMWSVGQKHIAYTEDGIRWVEVPPPD